MLISVRTFQCKVVSLKSSRGWVVLWKSDDVGVCLYCLGSDGSSQVEDGNYLGHVS